MGRKKEIEIKNRSEAENAMTELAFLRNQKEKARVQAERQILEIREAFVNRTQESDERAEKLQKAIKKYIKANRKEFGGKRTIELGCGSVKFTKSSRIIIPKGKETEILKELKGRNMLECILVDEKINRDVLHTYSAEAIAAVGAKLQSTEHCEIKTSSDIEGGMSGES